MPFTAKGEKILSHMEQEYGEEKGKKVFYASKNAGTISGVDSATPVRQSNDGPRGETPLRAAGVLIIDTGGLALFLKRGSVGDATGTWCFPGGKIEEGESPLAAAIRETEEETGYKLAAKALNSWVRRISLPSPSPEIAPVEPVDFTTFVVAGVKPFTPELGPKEAPEHVAYAWAPVDQAPEPLHPGCRIALDRFGMDELGVARAIASGDLTSPQHYQNVALFALRITGTGAAFRNKIVDPKTKEVLREPEYVWRDPAIYLNDEFLARCNGLQVIWKHPDAAVLTSDEFKERTIGAVMLPFIGNGTHFPADEVWGIAKIYDADAIELMESEKLSTSPGVGDTGDSKISRLPDGAKLLIEDKPSLFDHIAVCELGVWDKGGPPTGVSSIEVDMPDPKNDTAGLDSAAVMAAITKIGEGIAATNVRLDSIEAQNKARKDADEAGEKAKKDAEDKERAEADAKKKRHDAAKKDRFGKRHDGEAYADYVKRHDADEAAMCDAMRKDGESEEEAKKAAKDARRDAEEEERRSDAKFDAFVKGEEKKDASLTEAIRRADASDAEVKNLREKLATVETTLKTLTTEIPAGERDALAAAQYRADGVYALFGERASAPLNGESSLAYRKRVLGPLMKHSPKMKDARLDSADGVILETIENQIYADADAAARRADSASPGILIPVHETDAAGRRITKFHGDNGVWMAPFMRGGQVGRINRNPNKAA